MKCHEVDYKIIGDDMQIVEIELELLLLHPFQLQIFHLLSNPLHSS